MKNSLLPALALSSLLAATAARAAEPVSTETWGLRDAPRLVNPVGLCRFARDEVRAEHRAFEADLRGVRAGRPESLLKAGFTGARLAGVDGRALTIAHFAIHYATLDWSKPRPTLATALPATVAQAPDHAFRDGVRGAARGAVLGRGDAGSSIVGGLRGEALELVPAALHSVNVGFHEAVAGNESGAH